MNKHTQDTITFTSQFVSDLNTYTKDHRHSIACNRLQNTNDEIVNFPGVRFHFVAQGNYKNW